MKVTKEYLKKIIKETLQEVDRPLEKFAIFVDEQGDLEFVSVEDSIETAKQKAEEISDQIDNSSATPYEKKVIVYKLVEEK